MQQRLQTETAEKTVLRLTEKLKTLIDEEGIDLEDEDGADFDELIMSRMLFSKYFFLTNKLSNNCKLNDKLRMRWHPLMIRFALNLKYLSSSA